MTTTPPKRGRPVGVGPVAEHTERIPSGRCSKEWKRMAARKARKLRITVAELIRVAVDAYDGER